MRSWSLIPGDYCAAGLACVSGGWGDGYVSTLFKPEVDVAKTPPVRNSLLYRDAGMLLLLCPLGSRPRSDLALPCDRQLQRAPFTRQHKQLVRPVPEPQSSPQSRKALFATAHPTLSSQLRGA